MPREPLDDPYIHRETRLFSRIVRDDIEKMRTELGLKDLSDVIELLSKRVIDDPELTKKIFDPENDDIDTRVVHLKTKLPESVWDFYATMKKRSWRMKSTGGSKGLINAFYLIHNEIKKNGIEIKKNIKINPQSS